MRGAIRADLQAKNALCIRKQKAKANTTRVTSVAKKAIRGVATRVAFHIWLGENFREKAKGCNFQIVRAKALRQKRNLARRVAAICFRAWH